MILGTRLLATTGRETAHRDIALAAMMCAALLAGCITRSPDPAPPLRVTYHSDPEAATLYQGQQLIGYTPLTLSYDVWDQLSSGSGCTTLQPLHVRWASGATAAVPARRVCAVDGITQQYVFQRPEQAPGVAIDASFATQLQRNAILQQQARAQSAQADAQAAQAGAQNDAAAAIAVGTLNAGKGR